jgi:hypothetical protein
MTDCNMEDSCMVAALDSLSSGENESQETQLEWDFEPNKNRGRQKKIHLQATRQSSRLEHYGGKTVEELATKRKQIKNLEVTGNKNSNSFVILNNFDDEYLVDTAKDLGIELASDREGCLVQISVIKAEEKLRADLVEASYLAHLNKLKERDQEVGELDLAVIDNSYRGLSSTSDSNQEISSKK